MGKSPRNSCCNILKPELPHNRVTVVCLVESLCEQCTVFNSEGWGGGRIESCTGILSATLALCSRELWDLLKSIILLFANNLPAGLKDIWCFLHPSKWVFLVCYLVDATSKIYIRDLNMQLVEMRAERRQHIFIKEKNVYAIRINTVQLCSVEEWGAWSCIGRLR